MARKFRFEKDYPVVETKAGKLRGFELDDMFIFQGIKYADAKRWQAPTPVQPWEGIKDATNYGCICPTNGEPQPMGEIRIPHQFWPANENCQYLNIWTKSICKDAKKPVMVWFHGGGYSNGSSIEQVAYEGDALAEYGDVVVVTVNHRLNILGHLDMSSFGEKYANSVNAGIADLVACLEWVRDNIAGFGGDPDNVTIFGQSGGGGKVCTLLNTPAAAGLFHRAILMSGGAGRMGGNRPVQDARPVILEMMKELQIPEDEPERLEKVPYAILIRAYNRVARRTGMVLGWAPQANDWYLGHPLDVGFSDYAKKVPTMVSTVYSEMFGGMGFPFDENTTEEEFMAGLEKIYGENTELIVNEFKKAYPDKPLGRIPQMNPRTGIYEFMDARAQSLETPAYCTVFSLDFDLDGGTPAWHCADIPFVFHNSYRVANCNIEGVTEKLEEEVAGAYVNFARTGNPNHPNMPEWRAYTLEDPATMVFDRTSRCEANFDRELSRLRTELGPQRPPFNFAPPADDEDGPAWMY